MTQDEYTQEAVRLRPMLTEIATRYMGSADDAEDVVQDALVRLWNMHDELHPPLEALGRVLVRNLCIDRIRRKVPTLRLDDVDIGDSHVENVEHQRIERMMKIIDTLPTMQQTILRMRHMQGMEFKDIARLVGSEESTVRKALSRARMAVKDKYNTGIV